MADFNFGETASVDMEYKTFRQRIVDDIRAIIVRRPATVDDTSSETSLKYGTMTWMALCSVPPASSVRDLLLILHTV